MAQTGAPGRSRRKDAVPWWDELDSELFREFRATTIAEPAPPAVPVSLEPESEMARERPVTWAPRAANGRDHGELAARTAVSP